MQNRVLQSGLITPGHTVKWVTDGVIADGGAPALSFQIQGDVRTATIPSTVNGIQTLGYYAPGDGGGTFYKRAATAPGHALWFQSADGAFWVFAGNQLDIRMAGAKGDGIYNQATGVIVSGTDNTTSIQNCLDAHAYFGVSDSVYFPIGNFRITGPLHAGWGVNGIVQCRLIGKSNYRANNPNMFSGSLSPSTYQRTPSGAAILCDFTQGMGLNFAGCYNGSCEGIAFIGRNGAWIISNGLAGFSAPGVDDTVAANWVDPALPAGASNRFSPLAAITVDAYLGTPNYPAVSYPAFVGGSTPTFASAEPRIRDCYISGFVAGIVDAPGGATAADDGLEIVNCIFRYCQYGISWGQSQQRNSIRLNNNYSILFCAETTNVHGAQVGSTGPNINSTYAQVINWFLFGSTSPAPFYNGVAYQFIGCYGESFWRLGDIITSNVNETAALFDGCVFNFALWPVAGRGVSATMMDGYTPGDSINLLFRGCRFAVYLSVCPIMFPSECITMDGCSFTSNNGILIGGGDYVGSGQRASAYQQFASNATADGLILYDGTSRIGSMRLKFAQYNVDAGAPSSGNVTALIAGPTQLSSDRHHPACTYMSALAPGTQPYEPGIPLPQQAWTLAKSTITSATLVNKELQFTLAAANQPAIELAYQGPLPGDVIIDQATGSAFFVHSQVQGTGVVKATLQNNYYTIDAGVTFLNRTAISLSVGNFIIINSRLFTPSQALIGDLTATSATLANVSSPNGAFDITTGPDLANNDYYYADPNIDLPFGTYTPGTPAFPNTILSSVANGVFHTGATANYTQARKPLGIFIRPGPANS